MSGVHRRPERRLAAEAAFCLDGPVAHGGEGALDGVGGSGVFPVFGREIVEAQQAFTIRSPFGGRRPDVLE